jgi:NitT/TauT family transport system substrate-binding protein
MNRHKQGRVQLALISAIAVVASACGTAASPSPSNAPASSAGSSASTAPSASATATPQASQATIQYGLPVTPPTLDTVGIFFAIDNGYFADAGLNVQVTPYNGGPTATRALLSGQADIIEIDSGSAFLAYEAGAPIQFVSLPVPHALDVVLGSKSTTSIKDAAGKVWAISSPGGQSDVFARTILKQNGVDTSKVKFLAVGGSSARGSAVLAGKVDYTSMGIDTSQPILDAVDKGDLHILATVADEIPDYSDAFDATSPAFASSHSAELVSFLAAELKGYKWAVANPDDAAAIAAKHIPDVTVDLLKRAMQRVATQKIYTSGPFTLDDVQKTADFFSNNGLLSKPLKAADIATTQYIDQAAAK